MAANLQISTNAAVDMLSIMAVLLGDLFNAIRSLSGS